jgi:hypothetical protein
LGTPVSVNGSPVYVINSSSEKIISLRYPAVTTGNLTLHTQNNTDYQVPASKKLIIMKISIMAAANAQWTLYESDNNDSATGTIKFFYSSQPVLSTISSYDVYLEFAASTYPVVGGTTGNVVLSFLGVEVDA